ncbi:MAG TPA: VOC family protein [Pseudolabrys sp.]|jgi:catechol 2,3-dioxygenase|nr:VOC family protein [Pseudolabrys sp.]HVU21889.1 VOC family protein [Rhizomicrobium sp.]
MTNPRVIGVRSVELGVRNLKQSVKFYCDAWGLSVVSQEANAVHMRGTGAEHHLLTLREQPKTELIAVHMAAADQAAVDALAQRAGGFGADVVSLPTELPLVAGGGYGFRFRTPDGLPMSISCGVRRNDDVVVDRSKPTKISHVVLNSAETSAQVDYFVDVLGFRLSDSSRMMEFLRCSSDHHSMAIFRNKGPSLNHVAYEVPNIDGLMRGSGRMKENGFDIEWGVGRHGPGNNVFSYFIEPNGFVTEYTTEVEQVDDADHVPQNADYWHMIAPIPDRWRTAGAPGPRMRKAMAGDFIGNNPDERCEDIIAKKLG